MFHRILVAIDGSSFAGKAVACAIDLAVVHGAELMAVTVVRCYPETNFAGGVAVFEADDIGRAEARAVQDAQLLLDDVRAQASGRGVALKALILHSDRVGEAIIAAAAKQKSDVIVMASHGRTGIKRVLLGSETQYVLNHSTLPVLVLR